jgi:hypothetical protein
MTGVFPDWRDLAPHLLRFPRNSNVLNGACSAPQARWPAGFFP